MGAAAPADRLVVGLDVGGTSTKGVVAGPDGTPLGRACRSTPVADGVDAVVDAIVDLAVGLIASVGNARAVGIGLVLPGVVDREAGVARWSANIGWRDLPIRRLVGERTGLPVTIEHDVRAAGLAEVHSGAARGMRDVLFVSMGTGLAGALISGGRAVDGAAGMAGEIGHVPVVFPGGEPCTCGRRGCAEVYASAASVSRRHAALTGRGPVPAEDVLAAAALGEPAARTVLDDAIGALTRMILGVVLAADPQVVVLGGGMAAAGSALTGPVQAELQRALSWRAAPPVVVAGLGSDAGARGAALLAWRAADGEGVPCGNVPTTTDRP